jgi:hypothetical protein
MFRFRHQPGTRRRFDERLFPAGAASTRMSDIGAPGTVSGPAEGLKSFGRRRRTKVLEERTRGRGALAYGDFDVRSPLGMVAAPLRRGCPAAALQIRCAVRRLSLPRGWSKSPVRSVLPVARTGRAVGRSATAAARVWFGPCRVTEWPPRLSMACQVGPGAGSSGRRSR